MPLWFTETVWELGRLSLVLPRARTVAWAAPRARIRKGGRVQAIREMRGSMTTTEVFIGIDVDSLEIAVRSAGELWNASNDTAGMAGLVPRLRALRPT